MPTPAPLPDSSTIGALAAFGVIYAIIVIVALVLGIIINWRIASKAGYSGALSLLMLIPFVNIVIIFIFAFSKWPIEQQLEALRSKQA